MWTALGWVAIAALVLANAVFVAAEFGLTAVDRSHLAREAEGGDRRAQLVRRATRTLSFQLSGAQLGITISSLLLGFVAAPVIADAIRPGLEAIGMHSGIHAVSIVVALFLATVLQMLLGELVPQNLAIARPFRTSLAIVPLLLVFTRTFRLVIGAFNGAANAVVRWLGVEPQEELRSARSPAELRYLISSSAREGALSGSTAHLLRRTLLFGAKTAADVMTPRVEIVALPRAATAAQLLATARETGRSRFPVTNDNLDEIDGVVHIKAAYALHADERDVVRVDQLMAPPVLVPGTLDCTALLGLLREHGMQIGVVVDEFGGTAGLVTLEDLVEEITGQIADEFDARTVPDVVSLPGGPLSVAGRLHRDDFPDTFGWDEVTGPFDTLAGLVMARLGHLPRVGEHVEEQGWHLVVDRVDGRRIDRVTARPLAEARTVPRAEESPR